MNGFQMIILAVFIIALVVGTLIFAGVIPGFRAPSGGVGGTVLWWGTIPEERLANFLQTIGRDYRKDFTLQYVEKSEATLESDLVEALALGRGPDLVTLSSSMLLRQSAKLLPVPYSVLSKQDFRNTFVLGTHIREWELLFGTDGVLGLPLYVDPLVLYYNQNLLANAKLPVPPQTWSDLASVIRLLTKADGQGNITESAAALGSFSNITHAKDILALLLMQAGNPIVARNAGLPEVTLKDPLGFNRPPAGEAAAFFLRFADPANTLYSWNSSQPEAREAFLRGRLAFYLGWGSERTRLEAQNPQLNFALMLPFQRDLGANQLTLGRFHFLAIPRASANPQTAYTVAQLLTGPQFAAELATAASLPPARNDLLATLPGEPDEDLLYQAAVVARDWLDPDRVQSATVLRRMIESINLGRADVNRAINEADAELEALLPR